YGMGQTVDIAPARYCAYAQWGDDNIDEMMNGPAVLAMIYAGGKGVAPNLKLAVKFACGMKVGWGTNADIVKMLDEKQKQGATSLDFDVCDNPPGRQIAYLCIQRDQGRVAEEVPVAEKRFESPENDAERAAFEKLRDARQDFASAHQDEQP